MATVEVLSREGPPSQLPKGYIVTKQRIVLCMKWGTLYSAEYVNVLFNACKAHISGDFKFVCLTNEPQGIDEGVEVYPIPEIGLDEKHYYDGAWPKIGVFSKDLYGLQGRCLFIDLDSVICGSIDSFFWQPGALVAIDSAPWRKKGRSPKTMSSIFAFDIGALHHVVTRLQADRDALIREYHIEQDYLHSAVEDIQYWSQTSVASFKYHLRRPLLLDRLMEPKQPKNGTSVIAFHGRPRPIDLIRPPRGNWDVFPHYGSGSVSWMRAYWLKYGGQA